MGKKFFHEWVLWQQMTFVLACAIVGTIGIGLCKVWYDRWRIGKYKKIAAAKATQTPQMLEAQQPEDREKQKEKDAVPFGIRAIESGIEVDGVWISRSNTPAPSSPDSISSACNELGNQRGRPSSYSEIPRLEIFQPDQGSSSRASSRAPSSSFDRAASAERIPSRSSSPGIGSSSQQRFAPSSSRNSNPNLLRNSSTLAAPEGLDSAGLESRRVSDESGSTKHSSLPSRKSSSGSEKNAHLSLPLPHVQGGLPYEAAYLSPKDQQPYLVDRRVDLDLLQSHRLSHVAETGQLTPRVRRPAHSGEWASMADNKPETVDYFVPRRSTPSPPSAALNPFATPSQNSSAAPPTQDSHPANAVTQAVPLLQTYQPAGPHMDDDQIEAPRPVVTAQNQRDSQVLRKVNSGFEILRPGTFSNVPPNLDAEDEHGEKRQSKRLQKKRRTSSASDYKVSSFVEQG